MQRKRWGIRLVLGGAIGLTILPAVVALGGQPALKGPYSTWSDYVFALPATSITSSAQK